MICCYKIRKYIYFYTISYLLKNEFKYTSLLDNLVNFSLDNPVR